MLARWRALKHELNTLFYASRDPRLPITVRLWIAGLVAYAFSPIDLIPDFIPVLGYLDDLLLLPLGIYLALKWIPDDIYADAQVQAINQPVSNLGWLGAISIVITWIIGLSIIANLLI